MSEYIDWEDHVNDVRLVGQKGPTFRKQLDAYDEPHQTFLLNLHQELNGRRKENTVHVKCFGEEMIREANHVNMKEMVEVRGSISVFPTSDGSERFVIIPREIGLA